MATFLITACSNENDEELISTSTKGILSVGDGLHGAEYGRGDVSGDSEFYIKNQGKIATACSLSLIT